MAATVVSSLSIAIPSAPYHEEARGVYGEKSFAEWSYEDHQRSWGLLHTLVSQSEEYIVVGQQREGENAFEWQVVPFSSSDNTLIKQLNVFWKVLSRPQLEKPKELLLDPETIPEESPRAGRGEDIFCRKEQIEKQRIFEGREVVVLLNFAPHIAPRDTQPLDFLILPKAHRENFHDLRRSEYLEAMNLAAKLFEYFRYSSGIKAATLYHKTGPRAGQTVKHWHLHVTLSKHLPKTPLEKVQSILSSLFRDPLSSEALALRVEMYGTELSELDE